MGEKNFTSSIIIEFRFQESSVNKNRPFSAVVKLNRFLILEFLGVTSRGGLANQE